MPRNKRSERIERLENIRAAIVGMEEQVLAKLEQVARHPDNIALLHYGRQRCEVIRREAQALYQDEKVIPLRRAEEG
jgi:hypothetical protein